MEKEVTRIVKNGEEITKLLQLIENTNFLASSISNLVNNLSEGIQKIKCKYRHDDKICETCGIKYKYCGCFLEYINLQDDLIEYKHLYCVGNYQQKFDKKLKERFLNTCKFSNHDNNKFIFLLIKTCLSL